jgi:hypothetical protein
MARRADDDARFATPLRKWPWQCLIFMDEIQASPEALTRGSPVYHLFKKRKN